MRTEVRRGQRTHPGAWPPGRGCPERACARPAVSVKSGSWPGLRLRTKHPSPSGGPGAQRRPTLAGSWELQVDYFQGRVSSWWRGHSPLAGHGADAAPQGQPLRPLLPTQHSLHLFLTFRLCQARCCQPPPGGGASCSCPRFCLVPHPLTPSPGGTLWTILCMDQHVRWLLCCSRMDNAPAIRTPWAVAPPMHPSTHQGLCHSSQPPFSGLARLRPLNPPGPRLPLTATLSPFHRLPPASGLLGSWGSPLGS